MLDTLIEAVGKRQFFQERPISPIRANCRLLYSKIFVSALYCWSRGLIVLDYL